MLYINDDHMNEIGVNWNEVVKVIESTVSILNSNDFAQPIKPYLRYGNPQNRIIAMPAYVGGDCNMAGIKWIASFPDNVCKNNPRANSVVVLNNADTGVVESVFNTNLISIIRTSAVTGFMIKHYMKAKKLEHINVGIIGFGPIGQMHFKMCKAILGDKVDKYYLHDIRPIIDVEKEQEECSSNIICAKSWQEAYDNVDIFMCCTVAKSPYIDIKPKKGALVLNISLRDFTLETYKFLNKHIVVDNWEEVCRENTTIDSWNRIYGLQKDQTSTMADVLNNNYMKKIPKDDNIMFCPMGMGVFDIAIATYYYRKALDINVAISLK